ncbi:MAG: hypothetical protein WBW81_07295, partial [Methylocella sp.]
MDIHVGNCLLDLWHVAGDAPAARAARLVMGVFRDGGGMRPGDRLDYRRPHPRNLSLDLDLFAGVRPFLKA